MISSFAGVTFAVGILVATIGALFILFLPKKINWIYGYRTLTATRSGIPGALPTNMPRMALSW